MDRLRRLKESPAKAESTAATRNSPAPFDEPAFIRPLDLRMVPRDTPSFFGTRPHYRMRGLPPLPAPTHLCPSAVTSRSGMGGEEISRFVFCPSPVSISLTTSAMAAERVAALHGFDLLFVADVAVAAYKHKIKRGRLLAAYGLWSGPCPLDIPGMSINSAICKGNGIVYHKGEMSPAGYDSGVSYLLGQYRPRLGSERETRFLIAFAYRKTSCQVAEAPQQLKFSFGNLFDTMLYEARKSSPQAHWAWAILE